MRIAADGEVELEAPAHPALPMIGPQVGVAVPLALGEDVLGGLELTFAGRRTLTDEDHTFLQACAAQGAQGLRRAELYVEVDTRSSQQAVVAALGARALRTRDLPTLIGDATDQVTKTLRAERVRVVEDGGPPTPPTRPRTSRSRSARAPSASA